MIYLVIDSGLYVELANALSDNGRHRVLYYTSTGSAFPSYKEVASGHKFENLEKVNDIQFWSCVEKADAIVTFDVGMNGMIDYLRKKYPNKSVFGAGRGEQLENNRLGFKKTLQALKLPCIPYEVIKGFSNLRKYLEANPKKVVKIDVYRGDFETLKVDDFESVKQILKDREPHFGIFSEEVQFIVEDMVDCVVETGFDGFFNGSEFKAFSYGYEVDKNLYLGKVSIEVPEVLSSTLETMKPIFERFGYRGCLSTEERIVSEKEHYFIDPCCRGPLPLGVLYSRFIKNWPEVVYKVGRGEEFEIDCDHKYVGAFALGTTNAKEYFTKVKIKEGHRDDFRFLMATQNEKGDYYAVKGHESVIVAVAGGDSPKEVVEALKKNVENVEAFNLETGEIEGIDEVFKKIEDGKRVGVDF
jgi:hypothetical protein